MNINTRKPKTQLQHASHFYLSGYPSTMTPQEIEKMNYEFADSFLLAKANGTPYRAGDRVCILVAPGQAYTATIIEQHITF